MKFKTESEFLDWQNANLKMQIQNEVKDVLKSAASALQVKAWVRRYPFVSVGAAFSVGVVSTSACVSHMAHEVQSVTQLLQTPAIGILQKIVQDVMKQIKT